MGVRLNSVPWAQKRFIPTFYTSCTSGSWKIFFSPIRASWWVLDSSRPPEPKNVWFLLSRHDVCRVHEKFFLPIRANWWDLHSIRSPETKNVSFLLSRHHVHRVHEKFSSRRFERADGCYTHFGLLSSKTLDFYFLDMMYVAFMKNFLLADSIELFAIWLISASWALKRLIPTW